MYLKIWYTTKNLNTWSTIIKSKIKLNISEKKEAEIRVFVLGSFGNWIRPTSPGYIKFHTLCFFWNPKNSKAFFQVRSLSLVSQQRIFLRGVSDKRGVKVRALWGLCLFLLLLFAGLDFWGVRVSWLDFWLCCMK